MHRYTKGPNLRGEFEKRYTGGNFEDSKFCILRHYFVNVQLVPKLVSLFEMSF